MFVIDRRMLASWVAALLFSTISRGADLEREPISYSTAPADNIVARLQQQIAAGQVTLQHEEEFGYLRSLLRELRVSESSQMLVFSKTSLQRQRIGPRMPRAIYFSDDVYVGFCQKGEVLELSAVDPQLGTVFYTLGQHPAEKPRFVRQNDACLICHGSSFNQGFPGHLVRSVHADEQGNPILSEGSYRTDQRSPLAERWGGWYVTGTCGAQKHLGNRILDKSTLSVRDPADCFNCTDLSRRFVTSHYLNSHSDIVALLVLEHQAEMHNLITRANMQTRLALYEEAGINQALGRPLTERLDSTRSRIKSAGEPLMKYLFFSKETQLTEPIGGSSAFAREFAERGPRDARGRSLRDFDLQRRLFKYPCSYLIDSPAFAALPALMRDYLGQRIEEILSGKDKSADFAHLSPEDRQAIREILCETKALQWAGGGKMGPISAQR